MRLFSAAPSPFIAHRRRRLVARHPVVARMIDRREMLFARALPTTRDDAADLLAELVMIHAVERMMLAPGLEEHDAVVIALQDLFGDVLDGDLLVRLAAHVDEAMRRIPDGFSSRLLVVPAMVGHAWPMRRAVARS